MEKIITITLNPAIDKSTTAPFVAPEKKIRCESPKFEPGGGGINVSRALKKLGGTSTAIFLAGGHTGKFLESLVKQEGIDCVVIPFSGYTRENLIVMDESNDQQYRFGYSHLDLSSMAALYAHLCRITDAVLIRKSDTDASARRCRFT